MICHEKWPLESETMARKKYQWMECPTSQSCHDTGCIYRSNTMLTQYNVKKGLKILGKAEKSAVST